MNLFGVSYRLTAILVALTLILGMLGGGLLVTAAQPALSEFTSFAFSENTVTVHEGSDTNYEVIVLGSDGEESDPTTATNGAGDTVYTIPGGVNGELQVGIKKAGGNYVFSGKGTGNIVVKKAATADATLYFNGLNLTSGFTSVVAVNKESTAKCTMHVVEGTVNTLTDNVMNNDESNPNNSLAENAVIKCKADSNVTIGGEGTLNIKANGKNGIKANNLFTITDSVILNIDAADDGISGENTVTVNSGYVNITAKAGDGIKCGADDAPTGDVVIHGGTLKINAYGDGIQATANLTINGGVLDITCYGGYTATYNGDNASYPSAKGLKASGSYENESGVEVDATECYLKINGGFIKISSPDDAIHSDKDLAVTAGVLDLYTADDGIHAEYLNTIGAKGADNTALYITIHKCYEGIEGANIAIHSGIINIFASDDSINAANSDLGNGYNFTVTITGGVIYCSSFKGDCLDSNRNFTISGGTLVVLGSITQQDNTAVDTDGSFNIQGGEILTIGNSGMMTNPTTTQSYCTWTSAGTVTASASGSNSGQPGQVQRPGRPGAPGSSGGAGGAVVSNNKQLTITDASGKVLISVVVKWDTNTTGSAGYVLYSSPDVASGSNYTLTVGNAQTVTGGSYITSLKLAAQPETPETDIGEISSTPSTDEPSSNTPPFDEPSSDGGNQSLPPVPPSDGGSQPELPAGMTKGDVDQDSDINAKDALRVLKFAVNK
ncbi:MAG: carbohydrate-binding domain-containing protein, partial [Clostridia bacterium]|nr:carbohydrate-binding domain-containing protein [Clostridia bacterium]